MIRIKRETLDACMLGGGYPVHGSEDTDMIESNRRKFLTILGLSVAAPVAALPAKKQILAEYLETKNPLHIPPEIIPDGVVYNWKRVFITADEPDFENIVLMVTEGWRPVPAGRHPEYFEPSHNMAIEVGGLMLMEKARKMGDI